MSKLMSAVDASKTVTTENGMAAYNTSGKYALDLFAKIGSSRDADLSGLFLKAMNEDSVLAARILLWSRDCRGGAGERGQFRKLLGTLIRQDLDLAARVLAKTPELGRWDDVLVAIDTPLEDKAVAMIRAALESGDRLCAKWMPRKGEVAAKLRYRLGYTPKFYRKRLVELTQVVETQMCQKKWDEIVFEHVPSVAQNRYAKAFHRNAGSRYAQFISAVEKGEAVIHQTVNFPHDVIRTYRFGDKRAAEAMWKSLPDYMADADERIIPVIDVSGSMDTSISGQVRAIDVAVGLGIYFAQRNRSIFKGETITFSARPEFITVGDSLADSYAKVMAGDWGMNTDLEAVFKMILDAAVKGRVAEEDMPSKILIMSDMQFDKCVDNGNDTAMQMIKRQYETAGYKMPSVVFWNLCARETSMPLKVNDKGVAIMSGFSPVTVKTVLGADIDPLSVMLKAVMNPRYDL